MQKALKTRDYVFNENEESKIKRFFEELLLILINTDNAREKLHFKYVSPEWIGKPGWFFWPIDRKGVFYLRLVHALGEAEKLEGRFHLYYYPHPSEEVFCGFSFVEQLTRVSYVFESKKPEPGEPCPCHSCKNSSFEDLGEGLGIPSFEIREKLNPWLFNVGEVVCTWEAGILKYVNIKGLELSRSWNRDEGGVMENELGKIALEGKDRELPAWDLTEDFCLNFLKDLGEIGIFYDREVETRKESGGEISMKFSLYYEPSGVVRGVLSRCRVM